jgi:hypothetical protein
MENTFPFQTEKSLDYDSLVLASLLLLEVHRFVRDIQMIVAVLLRYATLCVSIADSLIQWIDPALPADSKE